MRDTEERMKKSIEVLQSELAKIRTGRAHPNLLDHVTVEYYGSQLPLNQVSSITVEDVGTLLLNVWEKDMGAKVEKAIINAGLGLNPVVAGSIIRIPMPPLTEERRRELVKIVRQQGETAKVAVRNVRRDAKQQLKDRVKAGEMSRDEEKKAGAGVENLTAEHVKRIDAVLQEKEKELMEI